MSELSLHAPTVLALSAAIAATLGALIIFSWMQGQRDNYYLALWGVGNILGGIAAGLLFTRGVLADFVSINVASALLALAYGVTLAATRAFGGKRTAVGWVCAGAMLWLAACGVEPLYASQTLRIVLISTLISTYALASAVELWRARAERLPSLIPAVAVLAIHAAACACRIPVALFGGLNSLQGAAGAWFGVLAFESLIHVLAMAILVVSMAKERAELEQRVVASTDELTGAATRRSFLFEGEKRIEAARKSAAAVSLLLFDLDHFKTVNDGFGHEMGDRVLRAFADCAAKVLEPGDLFGRIGGEEFAALLVGCNAEATLAVAEQMRRAVAAIEVGEERTELQISVSIGVSTATRAERLLGEMLREADRALYCAKSAGRNRVERLEASPKLVA
jgi:diguanylate cyclase (GGDEF)-like protein